MARVVRTPVLSAAEPDWSGIVGSITGDNLDFILDPWAPGSNAFFLSTDGVWRTTDIKTAAPPTWTQVLSAADVATDTGRTNVKFWYKLEASINQQDYVGLLVTTDSDAAGGIHVGEDDRRLYYAYTTDSGTTWNYSIVQDADGTSTLTRPGGGLALVPRLVGGALRVYAGAYRVESPERHVIYRSDNAGASWARTTTLTYSGDPAGPHCMMAPYHNNQSGNTVWVAFSSDNGVKGIYKSTDSGASFTQVTLPGLADSAHTSKVKRLGVEIYAQNSDLIAIWTGSNQLFKSLDGGATFSEIPFTGYSPATHGSVMGASGFPYSGGRYNIITSERFVFTSVDGGHSWQDRSGDIRTEITTNPITTGTRNGSLTPDWTDSGS